MTQTPVLIAIAPLIPILIAIILIALMGAVVASKITGTISGAINGPIGYALAGVILIVAVLAAWKGTRTKSTGMRSEFPKSNDSGTGEAP